MKEKENENPSMTQGDVQTILDHITSERRNVENYVNEELQKVHTKMDALQNGVSNLKTDMTEVKKDVSALKADMKQVKEDVNTIASDLGYERDAKKQLKSA